MDGYMSTQQLAQACAGYLADLLDMVYYIYVPRFQSTAKHGARRCFQEIFQEKCDKLNCLFPGAGVPHG